MSKTLAEIVRELRELDDARRKVSGSGCGRVMEQLRNRTVFYLPTLLDAIERQLKREGSK